MSGLILLESLVQRLKVNFPPTSSEDALFEFYAADNLLTNYDLDHTEIESGIVDGPRDAGVDAAFVFVNRALVAEDTKFDNLKQPVEIELVVIQAKNQTTIKEGPVDKLSASLPLLLDPTKENNELAALFNTKVCATFRSFMTAVRQLAGEFPKISIRIYYCSKGADPNEVVRAKASMLVSKLKTNFPDVHFDILGAQELYDRSSKQKRLVRELPTVGTPLSGDNSYVALCRLRDYAKFIVDDEGSLIARIFDANVRAYQGEVEVNREISRSLATPTPGLDFWWLNNGVTVVADNAQFMNNRLTIENPLIVNGLQTTHELYRASPALAEGDDRTVLVRLIVESDQAKRDEIIRATNRQTHIKPSSFRATEAVHREIEDYFLTIGYFYDRRKNFYKREGKAANKIVGIDRLAQAVLAILLQEPHVARARPTTAIKDDTDYKKIFSGDKTQQPLKMYGIVVQLLDRVEEHFRSIAEPANRIHRNNLKFHVLMVLAWTINGGTALPALAIPHLDIGKADESLVKATTRWTFEQFEKNGAEDRVAKDSAFTSQLKSAWSADAIKKQA